MLKEEMRYSLSHKKEMEEYSMYVWVCVGVCVCIHERSQHDKAVCFQLYNILEKTEL